VTVNIHLIDGRNLTLVFSFSSNKIKLIKSILRLLQPLYATYASDPTEHGIQISIA